MCWSNYSRPHPCFRLLLAGRRRLLAYLQSPVDCHRSPAERHPSLVARRQWRAYHPLLVDCPPLQREHRQ